MLRLIHLTVITFVLTITIAQDEINIDDLIGSLFNNSTDFVPIDGPITKPVSSGTTTTTRGTTKKPIPVTTPTARPTIVTRPTPTKQTPQPAKTTPTTTTTTLATAKPETCSEGGECVPFYLCINNTIISDGEGLIDIRFNGDEPKVCYDYLEVCCGAEDKVDETLIKPTVIKEGCGHRNTGGIGFRISGNSDSESEYGEFPWMVAVLKEERTIEKTIFLYQSGGSLIHPSVVLTAAHYVINKIPSDLLIRAGEWDTQTQNELFPHQDRVVSEIIIHDKFNKGNLHNDIALLILKTPVDLAENVQTVCLPPPNYVFDGNRCAASGWGKDVFGRDGKYQVILKRVELPIVTKTKCEKIFRDTRLGKRFILHESFICAGGEKGKDTCRGDGGSPLVCPIIKDTTERYYQAGIVAWGLGCGDDNLPGAYSNVALFRNWIDEQMKRKKFATSYYSL